MSTDEIVIEEVENSDEEKELKKDEHLEEQENPEGEDTPSNEGVPTPGENDEEPPQLEPVQKKQQSRSEKKAKKSILKLGLKPVPDVFRATIKKGKDLMFVISDPEVYRNSLDNTYVIFGEAKIDELGKKDWEGMTDDFDDLENPGGEEAPPLIDVKDVQEEKVNEEAPPKVETPKTDEKTEYGVLSKYIDIILDQINKEVKVTREQAAEALKANKNDIVSAIFSLEKKKMEE